MVYLYQTDLKGRIFLQFDNIKNTTFVFLYNEKPRLKNV